MSLLFSIPAHTNNALVCDVIENLQKFNINPHIILHINDCFTDFDTTIPSKYENVFVNPNPKPFSKYTSMIPALISNYDETEHLDYTHYCIFHTSQLMIKHGMEDYLADYDMSTFKEEYDINHRLASDLLLLREPHCTDMFPKIINGLAEGSFYRKGLFKDMVAYIKNNMSASYSWGGCVEEILLPTIGNYILNDGTKATSTLRIVNYIETTKQSIKIIKGLRTNKGTVDVRDDVVDNSTIFSVKHVPSSIDNPIRKYIRNLL